MKFMPQAKVKKILTKQQIKAIAYDCMNICPDVVTMARMAEERRHTYYKAKRRKKRKRKKYLKPTDYLLLEQVARILDFVKTEEGSTINRAVRNEMIIILLLETGMRASEICNLRLSCLPSYHGHLLIEVVEGKGKKDRTIVISENLKRRLGGYVGRYHRGHSLESFLFRSEQGKKMTRQSIYDKVKMIGVKTGIWLYRKDGRLKTRLSPQKFRHTFGTHLLDVTDNLLLVKEQLGHVSTDTTAIYARTLSEKNRKAMNDYSNRTGQVENGEKEPNQRHNVGKQSAFT